MPEVNSAPPAPPPASTVSPTPADNDASKAKLEAQHARDNQFQLDMLEMQQRFQQDQWWVTTLATIQKANHDTKMELARKFG
jgi:hypothetical protein